MKLPHASSSSLRNIVMFVVVSWSVTLACVLLPWAPSPSQTPPPSSSVLQPF